MGQDVEVFVETKTFLKYVYNPEEKALRIESRGTLGKTMILYCIKKKKKKPENQPKYRTTVGHMSLPLCLFLATGLID